MPCGATGVHLNVRIDKAYPDIPRQFTSVAQIMINQTGFGWPQAALMFMPANVPTITLRKYARQQLAEEKPFSAHAAVGEIYDVMFSWTADGSLSVVLNRGERHTIALGAPVRVLVFVVSGTKTEFGKVQFNAPAGARQCGGGKRIEI